MIFRRAYLENRSVLGDSGEKMTDISLRDPITCLWLEFRVSNSTTNNQANSVAANIDAIEILDGSKVLYSMDGQEALAWSAYYLGRIPNQLVDEYLSQTQNLSIIIPFGRFYGDTRYAFDPKRFVNPQVRVKWNLANVNAVGVTGFSTGTARLTVIADIMQGAPAPQGMFLVKEHYTSAGASSGVDYIDLPTDLPYLGLLIQAKKAGYAPYGVVSNVKLSCDQGAVVVQDMRMTDTIRYMSQFYGPFSYRHWFYLTSGDTMRTLFYYEETLGIVPENVNDSVVRYEGAGHGQGTLYLYTAGSVETADKILPAQVDGYCPYGIVALPFGDMKNPDLAFNAQDYRSVRLELTQAAASSTIAVALAQLMNYTV